MPSDGKKLALKKVFSEAVLEELAGIARRSAAICQRHSAVRIGTSKCKQIAKLCCNYILMGALDQDPDPSPHPNV